MAKLTLDVPDELVSRLKDTGDHLQDLLKLVLQLWQSAQQGQDVVVTAAGQEVLHLSGQRSQRQPLVSRTDLRSRQSLSHSSSLDTVQQLREEARY